MLQRRTAVCLILVRDGKALLGKRRGWGSGTWCFPAGHVEKGEAQETCAIREALEETGIIVSREALRYAGKAENVFVDRGAYTTHFYYACEFAGEAENLEPEKCDGWHWFPLGKLPSPLFAPAEIFCREQGVSFFLNLPKHCESVSAVV